MGAEIEVNSLEEMCDLMCNNKPPAPKEYYIFTFGYGQQHAGHYVKIFGNCTEARDKMIAKYGTEWAFQYSAKRWQHWIDTKPFYVPLEKELEVIE